MLESELNNLKSLWGNKCIIDGDFNMVLQRCERLCRSQSDNSIDDFHSILNNLELNDIPLKGGNWTWSNQCDQPFSRIDIFLISSDILLSSDNIIQKLMPRPISDHYPILLAMDGIKWGPIPFCLSQVDKNSKKALKIDLAHWLHMNRDCSSLLAIFFRHPRSKSTPAEISWFLAAEPAWKQATCRLSHSLSSS